MSNDELEKNNSGRISAGAIIELEAEDTCLKTSATGFIEAEYMYGCTATALGILLAYYDIYGHSNKDMSTLIGGVLDIDSRGTSPDGNIYDMSDPSTLANFIASTGYIDRFYQNPDKQVEFDYSFNSWDILNTEDFDSLADYIGTGQYGRDNEDKLTSVWYDYTLDSITSSNETYTVNGKTLELYYSDFLYGLSLYAESRGYELNREATGTTLCDTATYKSGGKGKFTFEDLKAEIDAGRPLLVHLIATNGEAHTITVYGYSDQDEIIFDDNYRTGCRMDWNGTYEFNNSVYTVLAATTVVFNTENLYDQVTDTPKDKCIAVFSDRYSTDNYIMTSAINAKQPLLLGVTNDFMGGKAVVYKNTSSSRTSHILANNGTEIIAKEGSKLNATLKSGGLLNIESGATVTVSAERSSMINFTDGILGTDDDTVVVGSVSYGGFYVSEALYSRDFTYSNGVLSGFTLVGQWNKNDLELYYGAQAIDLLMTCSSTLTIHSSSIAKNVETKNSYIYAGDVFNDGAPVHTQVIYVKNTGRLEDARMDFNSIIKLERNGTAKNIYLERPDLFEDPEGMYTDPETMEPDYFLYGAPATLEAEDGGILEGYITVYGMLNVLPGATVQADNADIQFGLASDNKLLDEFFDLDGSGLVVNADKLDGAVFSLATARVAENFYSKVASYTDDSFYTSLTVELINSKGEHTGIYVTDTQNAICDAKEYDMTTSIIDGVKYVQISVTDVPVIWGSEDPEPLPPNQPCPRPIDPLPGTDAVYLVDYSLTADFEKVVRIKVSGDLTPLNLDNGTHYIRARYINSNAWSDTQILTVSSNNSAESLNITITEDLVPAIIFATSDSLWSKRYAAEHQGIKGSWSGTGEIVVAGYRNRFNDIFNGCGDHKNVIYLTDTDNGDAIFMADIFSSLPDGVAKQQSRIANITEIRAGLGDDIIDMTSKTYAYTGSGMTIRGGDGDDVIWSNKGDNNLFGDAGNDRIVGGKGNDLIAGGSGNDSMHGGGGKDVFFFCNDWGNDTVEQLTGGKVTLCFEQDTFYLDIQYDKAIGTTISDGTNTILVKKMKITQDNIISRYDLDTAVSDYYNELGVFSAGSTCAIYETEKDYDNPASGLKYADIC